MFPSHFLTFQQLRLLAHLSQVQDRHHNNNKVRVVERVAERELQRAVELALLLVVELAAELTAEALEVPLEVPQTGIRHTISTYT